MAVRSDFAQKLLHDLRIRKERMAASQRSSHADAMTRDTYRNPGNVQRGSRQMKTLESIGVVNQRPMSSGGSGRALGIKESSQQIVTYGGGRRDRSESIGDLSMAFTYAVKNGGKLVNMDFSGSGNTNTMIDFLHRIGRKSLDVGKARNELVSLVKHRPANGTVPVPAFTNAQIKEISKGVQNLYEILRSSSSGMNVDRYSMEVGKELLKGARGLEESLRMLVNLQEASELMVSTQRKSRITLLEVDDDDEVDHSKKVNQNQVALPRFSFDKPSKKSSLALTDASSKLQTHRRSTSLSSSSDVKDSSSRIEKGRISNVIAKLMGLEEVPGKLDSLPTRNESRNTEPRIEQVKKQANKGSRPAKEALASLSDQKSQESKNFEGVPGPHRAIVTVARQQSNNGQLYKFHENQERQSSGETKEKIQQKRRSPDIVTNVRQERVDKKKTIRMEKSNEIRLVSGNGQMQEQERTTQKSKQDSQPMKHKQGPFKSKDWPSKEPQIQPFEENLKAKYATPKIQEREPERTTQKSKQDSQSMKHNQGPFKSKDWPSKEPQVQPFEENLKAKDATPKTQEREPERRQGNVQPVALKEKPITRKKADSMAVHRTEALRKKDEVLKTRNGSSNSLGRLSKRKDVQQLASISSKREEITIKASKSKKSESRAPLEHKTKNASSQVPICIDDIKIDPHGTSETLVAGKYEVSSERTIEIGNLSQNKPKKSFYSSEQVVLTEQEKQLKEIVIKDQLFLSTAKALFKLDIPVGVLHVDDDHNRHGDETKLKLDCGYEILRRKARNQELSVHPYMKPSVGGTTIRFLDDLVKQLYRDLEILRLYNTNARNEYDEADYLLHMLERDIGNKDPDINSFWDFGWHTTTFAFVEKDEFVKDVEQDVIDSVIDEFVEDLVSVVMPF